MQQKLLTVATGGSYKNNITENVSAEVGTIHFKHFCDVTSMNVTLTGTIVSHYFAKSVLIWDVVHYAI